MKYNSLNNIKITGYFTVPAPGVKLRSLLKFCKIVLHKEGRSYTLSTEAKKGNLLLVNRPGVAGAVL